jgi:molybdate transport system permease protein
MARLGLAGLEARFPDELSSGQRQRVALARALSRGPSMLLLDEPFASLDTPVRNELRRELRSLQLGAGATSVLVTHDPEEAALLADEILVIEGGKLLQAGTRAEVFGRPASIVVARLLGIRNLLGGRILRSGVLDTGGVQLHVREDSLPPGADVRWYVPAECIGVGASGSHKATVLDVADLGSGSEIQLRLEGLKLIARTPTVASLRPGTECFVEVPSEAIRLWPVDGVTS